VHGCDLDGSTEVVFRHLELDARARERGVSIVPDRGVALDRSASSPPRASTKWTGPTGSASSPTVRDLFLAAARPGSGTPAAPT
jgi:hypothetical protein